MPARSAFLSACFLFSGRRAALTVAVFGACCVLSGVSVARVDPPAVPPMPASPPQAAGPYTGVVVDARHLPTIDRSPAPCICGADGELLYPDRAHVPTPDEVQEQSIVRYYFTEESAEKGAAGDHPLIVHADAVLGPAHDGLQVSAAEAERLKAADKDCQYTRTWKVAFLIPEGR